jgi:SAM-dependent methyltransferase
MDWPMVASLRQCGRYEVSMRSGALQPYEDSLRTGSELALVAGDGRLVTLDVSRWLAPVDPADETVLLRCIGPVLDVGCGPGRFVRALAEQSIACLGLDIAETAIALTRGQGVPALLRNVFAPVPGEGRWPTVLLMDGNVGIGGDPARLLLRVARLLSARGQVIVELDPAPDVNRVLTVHFAANGVPVGLPFEWAQVGRKALGEYAERARLQIEDCWSVDKRVFAALRSRLVLIR